MSHFEIYKDAKGEFRWRLRASNGKILADCGEGYVNRSDCEHGIDLIRKHGPSAPIKDETAAY